MPLYFVNLVLGNKNYKERVSTEGCEYVDDFKGAIKSKFSPLLDSYASAQLTLFQPVDGTTEKIDPIEIDPGEVIEKLKEFGLGPWKPMEVTVLDGYWALFLKKCQRQTNRIFLLKS